MSEVMIKARDVKPGDWVDMEAAFDKFAPEVFNEGHFAYGIVESASGDGSNYVLLRFFNMSAFWLPSWYELPVLHGGMEQDDPIGG